MFRHFSFRHFSFRHYSSIPTISLVEGQCLGGKLPDTVNVAIQIDGTQVHERYATKQNDFDEKRIRIISKSSLNQEILGFV
ncbi:unnamed protein product [Rotaria sp. Silwood2]|nr:unnamed protein product [Rotaria sp. Silwood2]